MKNRSSAARSVEQLERFGKLLSDIPKEAFEGQGKIIFAAFRRKFGLLGLVPFALRVLRERRRLLKQYAQLDELVRCDGDVFDNFKKFNVAMFEAGDRDFRVQKIEETDNHLRIVVDRCLNVEAGKMFDCPEIAKPGCDCSGRCVVTGTH